MPNIGAPELILILAVALLVLGPKRLPEVGASLGKTIREFRKATAETQESLNLNPAPSVPAAPAAPVQVAPAAPTPQPVAPLGPSVPPSPSDQPPPA